MLRQTKRLAAAGVLALAGSAAPAQDFPTKPITWIVPFTPGGITDLRARQIADELGKALGETVVVENKPGAGGTLGVEYVARAEPDGYTVVYGSLGTQAAAPSLYSDLRYDSDKDFVPIHMMGLTPNTMIAYEGTPYDTTEELVAYAKEHPGEVTVGLAGIGTGTHLAAELFAHAAGIEFLDVPYPGSAPMLNDLIAGRLDVAFDYPVTTSGHAQAGSVKVLGVTSEERLPLFPDAETMAEAGYPDATTGSWSGLFAPAGTPPDRIAILADAFETALGTQTIQDAFASESSQIVMMRGDEMRDFVASEVDRWTEIIEGAGIEKQ